MEEPLKELLDKVKIEEVIQDYVELKKRGSNYIGLCPFHKELSPSFTVSPSKQIYKCFGCGKSGNAFSFLIEINNYDLKSAINALTKKFDLSPSVYEEIKTDEFKIGSIIPTTIKPIMLNLDANISSVFDLVKFDKIILEFCIDHLEELENRISQNEEIKITNVRFLPSHTLEQLRNIKQNQSLTSMYGSMYNQGVVLLISYFTSSLKELFRQCINFWASNNQRAFNKVSTEIKITFDELHSYNFNLSNSIGDLIIKKKGISFQDMQSTLREFESYFGVKIEKKSDVDNIIIGQAARHAIVHSLAIADEKFINQISDTTHRNLKKDILLNDDIKFSIEEIEELTKSIKAFFRSLVDAIIAKTV